MVELLINKGAEVDARNKKGITPLQWAVRAGHKEVEEMLRKHGAKECQFFGYGEE